MSFSLFITTLFKYLPELIDLVKWLAKLGGNALDQARAKKTIKNISLAFKYADEIEQFDAKQTAGDLDAIFNGASSITKSK